MHTRYTITHIGRDGFRTFTLSNTGTSHDHSMEQAEDRLASMLANNNHQKLAQLLGPSFVSTARVDSVECYGHGDRMAGGFNSVGLEYRPELDLDSSPEDRIKMARAVASIS